MKVLLLNPPNLEETKVEAESIPFGLLHIKEFISQRGFAAQLINLGNETHWSTIEQRLAQLDWDVVGISCYTTQRLSVYRLADVCKSLQPDGVVVLGGPHATLLDTAILHHVPNVDYIVRREGELPFLSLIQHLKAGNGRSPASINGVTYRDCTRIVRNPAAERIKDLSSLPAPVYTLDDVNDFKLSKSLTFSFERFGRNEPVAFILNSRGCTNTCMFCCNGTFWQNQLYYSPEYVFAQLADFYRNLNVRLFDFSDDDFLHCKSHVHSLCELITENGLDIHWWCAGRAENIESELLETMKRAGCFMVSYGFETGSSRILRNIQKRISVQQAVKSAQLTRDAGLLLRCTMTVGHPGEDDASIQETIDFLKETRPDQIALYIMRMYPGTPIYRRAKEEGVIADEYWFDTNRRDLPFYTTESSLEEQIEMRDRIGESLSGHVVEQYADEVFQIQHMALQW